jgi:hypothetical protein
MFHFLRNLAILIYKMSNSNSMMSLHRITDVAITLPVLPIPKQAESLSTGLTAGIAIGVVAVGVAIVIALCHWRRSLRRNHEVSDETEGKENSHQDHRVDTARLFVQQNSAADDAFVMKEPDGYEE